MTSIFTAFCYILNCSSSGRSISGTATYRSDKGSQIYRDIVFKGFPTSNQLISNFQKNSIVLFVGRYVYEDDEEYVTLIQTTNVYEGDDLSVEDLPNSAPLLTFTAPIEKNHIVFGDNNKNSFIMARKLYNGVNQKKNIENRMIVSYTNENGRYDTLKNYSNKAIFSTVGIPKISKNKLHHLISSEIEWNVHQTDPQPSSNDTVDKADEELEAIESNYDKKINSNKKRKTKNPPIATTPISTHTPPSTSASTSTSTSTPTPTPTPASNFVEVLNDVRE